MQTTLLQLAIDIPRLGLIMQNISEKPSLGVHGLFLPQRARVVDGALAALENARIVGDAADEAAGQRRDPGAPDPEVRPVREGVQGVADGDGGEAGPEVAGGVEAAAGRPTQGHAGGGDEEADDEGVHAGAGGRIAGVAEGEDRAGYNSAAEHLDAESGGDADVFGLGLGVEVDAGGFGEQGAVEVVDGVLVDGESEQGADEGTEDLHENVDGDAFCWEASEDGEYEDDHWVEEGA